MTIFNQKNIDFTKQPMFFGEELNSQRFDKFKFPKFDQLNEQMISFFWRPQEVSLQKDRSDYLTLNEHQKFIFTANLKYQTLLDSVQGRGPVLAFLPICSLPELESAINTWNFFEGSIHSKSYSYIMQNVFSNPTIVFDAIMDDEAILSRARSVTRRYDDFINDLNRYQAGEKIDLYQLKTKLYLAMINVNLLEGLRFYISFACTFALAEIKLMEGSAKIVSLIARDENVHFALTSNIINYWRDGKDDLDFVNISRETEAEVLEMYKTVIEEEKAWANHLFKNGSLIGLNDRLLHQYIDHMAVKRARTIGYKLDIDAAKQNPLPWTQHWLNSSGLQVAPQEAEIESYVISSIKQDIISDTFKGFKL